jgi:hypothetical protein
MAYQCNSCGKFSKRKKKKPLRAIFKKHFCPGCRSSDFSYRKLINPHIYDFEELIFETLEDGVSETLYIDDEIQIGHKSVSDCCVDTLCSPFSSAVGHILSISPSEPISNSRNTFDTENISSIDSISSSYDNSSSCDSSSPYDSSSSCDSGSSD